MTTIDMEPAARRLGALVAAVRDDQLDGPTPCPDYRLGDLVEHVGGLAQAFRAAAAKDLGGEPGQGPSGDATRLPADWRTRIPQDLLTMADAWRDPDAWTGMTAAGGVELPGEIADLVALDELVIHGWDIAQALGRPYNSDQLTLEAVHGFVSQFGDDDRGEGQLFGPAVPIGADAPLLHQVVGLAGRDPAWRVDLRR